MNLETWTNSLLQICNEPNRPMG